mgnify:CR=1 FL=1
MSLELIEKKLDELEHRVRDLELAVQTILKNVSEVKVQVEVPRVILEKKPTYVKIEPEELHGRIIMLALEGFLDSWRTAGEIASELVRRGWAPRDFEYVRPVLEHLVSIGVLERVRPEKDRRAKWLYKASEKLEEIVSVNTK